MDLKSMKMSAKDAKEYASPATADASDAPRYPYGLCLHINDETIKALGVNAMPDAGQTLMITARVKVASVEQRDTQKGQDRSMSLQITDMAIGPDTAKPSVEEKLYGNG